MSASRSLCCVAVLLALLSIAHAKTYFIEEDLGLISRDALQKLLGYPALIEPDDPQLEGGIGASSIWTYYFETRDQHIREIHFWFYKDKQLTHDTLDQMGIFKGPFRLLHADDLTDLQKIWRFKKRSSQRH